MLTCSDFHQQPTPRPQHSRGLWDEPFIDLKAGGTGEERGWWFVIAHLSIERLAFAVGNIRRIRNDHIEFAVLHPIEQVGFPELNVASNSMSGGVRRSHF